MKLDRLPWIDVPPYDQILTDLISSCQSRDMSLICIQGSNGSGKTRILDELLATLSFDVTASLIALSGKNKEVFYHNVEISADLLNIQHPQFLDNFTLTLEAILKDKQHFYILIDDVESLPYKIFSGLMKIIADSPIFSNQVTVVAFIGINQVPIGTQDLLNQSEIIVLPNMTAVQMEQFIGRLHNLMPDKMSALKISDKQLYSLSYGYVGRLLNLLKEEQANQKYEQSTKNHLKDIVIWFICMLVVVIGLVYSNFWPLNHISKEIESIEPLVTVIVPMPAEKEIPAIKIVQPVVVAIDPIVLPKEPEEIVQPIIVEKHYVIELSRAQSKAKLENLLKGRSIPGKAQFKQIEEKGTKIWVAYIGPYSSEKQAIQGKEKLPASLQSLPLKINKEF